jgi:hypothetical protein
MDGEPWTASPTCKQHLYGIGLVREEIHRHARATDDDCRPELAHILRWLRIWQ